MPKNFPRAPPPLLAATLAPCAWAWGAPDLFDSYSAGVILMQVGFLCRWGPPLIAGSAFQGGTGCAFVMPCRAGGVLVAAAGARKRECVGRGCVWGGR
jgi:hypothetical protein